jgi:hypothetical protein
MVDAFLFKDDPGFGTLERPDPLLSMLAGLSVVGRILLWLV